MTYKMFELVSFYFSDRQNVQYFGKRLQSLGLFRTFTHIHWSLRIYLRNTWMVASVNLQPFKMKLVGVIFM